MISISYPDLTAFFCSSILLRSSSVMVRLIVLMASFWSTDCRCIVTICVDSILRKSANILSLISDAVIAKKLMQPYIFPIRNTLPFLNSKLLGAMKSFTDKPLSTSQFQSNINFSLSPIWNCLCISSSLSVPFKVCADTPKRLKLLSKSISI